jgi:hypothetical protein
VTGSGSGEITTEDNNTGTSEKGKLNCIQPAHCEGTSEWNMNVEHGKYTLVWNAATQILICRHLYGFWDVSESCLLKEFCCYEISVLFKL